MESLEPGVQNATEPPSICGSSGSLTKGLCDIELEQSALIPGLPDDIALLCLARVPREYHSLLNCVSKRWRQILCSQEWLLHRRKRNLDETWVYALCRDKSEQLSLYVLDCNHLKKGWKRINGIPNRCLKRKGVGFEVSGTKLFLIGGCGWVEDATDEVYCYDASMSTWREVASLPIPRCYFAHESLNEKIYVIGGLGRNSSNPTSWDTFDPGTNCWMSYLDHNLIPDVEGSFVLDGKIYIQCGRSAVSSHVYAVVYEPSSGTWQHADADIVSGWRGPAVVIEGTLYVLDQVSGVRLMMWKKDTREWMAVTRLSPLLTRPPCQLLAIGKKIYVVGKGLSTVVFDIDDAINMDGILVSSSVPNLTCDDDVIGCKSLAI